MITEITARLKAEVSLLALVAGAADFQKASEANPTATPAAYVFVLRENAGPNGVAPDVHQRVAVEVGVILVVRNLGDVKGAAAGQDMETLRAAVKAVLLGWEPAAGYDALERGNSGLLAFRDGHMWWQDTYTTAFYDRSVL